MAGRRPKAEAVIPTNSMVASAVRYTGKAGRIYHQTKDWQKEAYRHYAICGEARFAANFFGHSLSRATLRVAVTKDGKPKALETGPGVDALGDVFSDATRESLLKAIGIHLSIAGECYLVGRDVDPADVEEGEVPTESYQLWEVISTLEMKVTGERWTIRYGGNAKDVELGDDDIVIRIWNPDPSERMQPDSPFKSLLPILSEIEWLTRHVFSQVQSRLAGAGILFLPQEMSFPPPPVIEGSRPPANDAEAFMLSLAEGMMQPIEDPSNPSAVIPFVVTAPADAIAATKLMHFWSNLDAESKALRQEAIHRFALGMDLPPEQVEGMSSNPGTGGGNSNGVSHWGAWQIEESTIKLHIEPMLELVCNAVTVQYLRPATGGDEFVIYDTSALRLRPDRSQEAILLYNLGLVSAKVVRRENGFDDDDAPDATERKEWLLMKVATGSATPEMVSVALGQLGVEMPALGGVPNEARPDPSMEPLPPPRDVPEYGALLAASDALVFRALERAGNRLRNDGIRPPVPSYETHTLIEVNGNADYLLEDAWSCAPQVLTGLKDPDDVIPVLTAYCKSLFATQQPHTRDRLSAWLERGVG